MQYVIFEMVHCWMVFVHCDRTAKTVTADWPKKEKQSSAITFLFYDCSRVTSRCYNDCVHNRTMIECIDEINHTYDSCRVLVCNRVSHVSPVHKTHDNKNFVLFHFQYNINCTFNRIIDAIVFHITI